MNGVRSEDAHAGVAVGRPHSETDFSGIAAFTIAECCLSALALSDKQKFETQKNRKLINKSNATCLMFF